MRKCKFVVEYFFELIYLGKTYFFRVDIFLVFFHKNDMEVEKKRKKKTIRSEIVVIKSHTGQFCYVTETVRAIHCRKIILLV